jgi:hypothetical protein
MIYLQIGATYAQVNFSMALMDVDYTTLAGEASPESCCSAQRINRDCWAFIGRQCWTSRRSAVRNKSQSIFAKNCLACSRHRCYIRRALSRTCLLTQAGEPYQRGDPHPPRRIYITQDTHQAGYSFGRKTRYTCCRKANMG